MNWKMILWAVFTVAVLSMNGCAPGSEEWNIRIAAHCYIKGGGLQDKPANTLLSNTLSAKRTAHLTSASFIF